MYIVIYCCINKQLKFNQIEKLIHFYSWTIINAHLGNNVNKWDITKS